MKCPRCGECPFPKGVCEREVSRGRRYFLMGALALPVAAQIERLVPIIAPPVPVTLYTSESYAMAFKYALDGWWRAGLDGSGSAWEDFK